MAFAKDAKGTVLNVQEKETERKEKKYSVIKDSAVLQEHVLVWMLKFAKDKTDQGNVAGGKKKPTVTRVLKVHVHLFQGFSLPKLFLIMTISLTFKTNHSRVTKKA